jgi:4-amino-4-deoxy-L-arabinose transferase-like glycosyltransferase
MKTLSLFICAFLVAFGVISCIKGTDAGIVLIIVGSLAFLLIAKRTEKVAGYNANHWMNK